MPTPMHVYLEIASRYGVDTSNETAIDNFYIETIVTLPEEEQQAILDELLCREGESAFSLTLDET